MKSLAFKNIPQQLVDLIENAPNILTSHDDEATHKLLTASANPLEQLVFGKS